ncbi:hypothetical protein [Bordetella bronchiseptica]|uniref:hypothetical protein n=1 Tax=Bordetella bronchiseptica TaxID=518 RepID=UPI000529331D|nr:hypothetical protein [Bordetella bronchiseptica]
MATSYSDLILQALAKHGRLNCRQLSGAISHDFKKTTQLVSFMRTNRKLETAGTIDNFAAYQLTQAGRVAAGLEDAEPTLPASPTSPASIDDLADVHMRPAARQPLDSRPPVRTSPTAMQAIKESSVAFGLLSTGEFLILVNDETIRIARDQVPLLRAQLNAPPLGLHE